MKVRQQKLYLKPDEGEKQFTVMDTSRNVGEQEAQNKPYTSQFNFHQMNQCFYLHFIFTPYF